MESWQPSGPGWTAALSALRRELAAAHGDAALAALAELQAPGLLVRREGRWVASSAVSNAAFGLLLLRPGGGYATSTLDEARGRLIELWSGAPGFSEELLQDMELATVRAAAAAAKSLLDASARPRATMTPRPVSAPGQPVRYLSDEQKAALNAKYGRLKPPTPEDMHSVLNSGSNCKMQ